MRHAALRYGLLPLILAAGMVCSAALISQFFIRYREEKSIVVKGYAEAPVTSDVGRFSLTVEALDPDRRKAYAQLEEHFAAVRAALEADAPSDAVWMPGNPDIREKFKKDDKGRATDELLTHVAVRSLQVHCADVQWIARANARAAALMGQGYRLSVGRPSFLVSGLDAVKLNLLEQAAANAHRRAELLARNSGARVGTVHAARQGVFQITGPRSTKTSGYGVYDTDTIDKVVKAVGTVEYAIE